MSCGERKVRVWSKMSAEPCIEEIRSKGVATTGGGRWNAAAVKMYRTAEAEKEHFSQLSDIF